MLFTQAAGLVCPGVDRKSEWCSCGEVRCAGGTVAAVAPILELCPACSHVSLRIQIVMAMVVYRAHEAPTQLNCLLQEEVL